MKKYYYILKDTKKRGYNVEQEIYLHTRDGMEYIGVNYYNTATFKGSDSEAFNFLKENGFFKLTKKQEKELTEIELKSINSGYFTYTLREKNILNINSL